MQLTLVNAQANLCLAVFRLAWFIQVLVSALYCSTLLITCLPFQPPIMYSTPSTFTNECLERATRESGRGVHDLVCGLNCSTEPVTVTGSSPPATTTVSFQVTAALKKCF